MAKAIALLVGSPTLSQGGGRPLPYIDYCDMNLEIIKSLLEARGFRIAATLFQEQATSANIFAEIEKAKRVLAPGDMLVFYFTGHGHWIKDVHRDEDDGMDEYLVAWDRLICDDEFRAVWSTLDPSIRLLTIVDACHSGTPMTMPMSLRAPSPVAASPVQISCRRVHLGACADPGTSIGDFNCGGGYFTVALRDVMNSARPPRTYPELVAGINLRVPEVAGYQVRQTAQLDVGPSVQSSFDRERPFEI